jgi:heme/copper-type cytochrome/quinol oxidase subunit 4
MHCSRCQHATLVIIPIIILSIAVIGLLYLIIGPMQIKFSKDEQLEKYCVITGIISCIVFIIGSTCCIAEVVYKGRKNKYLNMEVVMETKDIELEPVKVNVSVN